jgi:hypothetical protein
VRWVRALFFSARTNHKKFVPMNQDGDQLTGDCPKCKAHTVTRKPGPKDCDHTEFYTECDQCHFKWDYKFYEGDRLVHTIPLPVKRAEKRQRDKLIKFVKGLNWTHLPATRAGKGQRGKFSFILDPSRFTVLRDKCLVCNRPLWCEEKNRVFFIWCASPLNICQDEDANNGAEAPTLSGALEKFYGKFTNQKGLSE